MKEKIRLDNIWFFPLHIWPVKLHIWYFLHFIILKSIIILALIWGSIKSDGDNRETRKFWRIQCKMLHSELLLPLTWYNVFTSETEKSQFELGIFSTLFCMKKYHNINSAKIFSVHIFQMPYCFDDKSRFFSARCQLWLIVHFSKNSAFDFYSTSSCRLKNMIQWCISLQQTQTRILE